MGREYPLKGKAPRLLGKHIGHAGREYRRAYDALAEELGPFGSRLLRMEAGRTAMAWVNLELASRALEAARHTREQGRGRRPTAQEIERLARRHGLADQTYSQALDKLRDLASCARRDQDLLAALKGREGAP